MKKELWEILVPTTLHGTSILEAHHHKWDEYVRSVAGGLTLLHTVKGQWISPKQVAVAEPVIPVRVICTKAEIRRILRFTKRHYKQEVVLAYRLSDEVLFL